MVAARGHLVDGPEGHAEGEDETPLPFRRAVEALLTATVRPGVELRPVRAPRRIAPFAYAVEAAVEVEGEELADGRLVLLHDPDGQDAWRGAFRLVTLLRADLEPEMASDPLLPEVCWSWLTGALDTRGVTYTEPSGTVTRAGSYYFGGIDDREASHQIELRASWTPGEADGDAAAQVGAHLTAWCELLCQCAGLPPAEAPEPGSAGVVSLPQRRGHRQR